MPDLRYHTLDVFTDRPFGGNPLAVFTDGRGLSTETMQSLAKELNLSETTFVLPPQDPANHFQVRIFTPAAELPTAGHPTVGTAYILARQKMIDTSGDVASIRFEEGVGVIPVELQLSNGIPTMIRMTQPLPTFGPRFESVEVMADMLSIDPALINANLPMEVGSCGVPFLFVPLRNLDAARKVRLRQDIYYRELSDFATQHVFVFTQEVENEGSTVHSRMFAPALGVAEDPATGIASGPLGCYLLRHGLVSPEGGTAKIVSEQGIEMGRPSFIHIEIEEEGGEIKRVRVGGQCHYMGEGRFDLSSTHVDGT
ncbi:MAG TPA: PhzF family phenazine biosynthesis protein [Chloroflexia bacterium]|jgi:trans-2,3-dihydro-3-hydroxyanthranilate isomerase